MIATRVRPRAVISKIDARVLWPLVALALLLVFNLIFSPRFLSLRIDDGRFYGGLIDMLENAAPLILVATGMAFVIGTGGIDLSVGAVMAIAGTIAAGLVARPEYSPLSALDIGGSVAIAILIAVIAAGAAGVLNGTLVAFLGVQPLMATLVLMVAGRGVAQLLSSGQVITFQDPALHFLGAGALLGFPIAIWIAFAGVCVSIALVRWTALGFFAEAIGDNRAAAVLSGVPARTVMLLAYVLVGLLSGVAGVLVACDIGAADPMRAGRDVELDAILAVVVGGTALTGGRFSILGAVVGALLIQTLTITILAQGISEEASRIVKGGAVLALCLLQSDTFRASVARWIEATAGGRR